MESTMISAMAEWRADAMASATDTALLARNTAYPRTKVVGNPVSSVWNNCADCMPRSTHFKATFWYQSAHQGGQFGLLQA